MSDEPDYILDLHTEGDEAKTPGTSSTPAGADGKWLGVQFECCGVYARVYRNRNRTAYVGHCPRCGRPLKIGIGPGGVDQRFFRAT